MKPKKTLGQHFLTSQKVIHDICIAGEVTQEDTVLEIGPGKGILTQKLLENAGHVIVVEKDRDLIPFLEEKFHEEITKETLEIIEKDILNFSADELPNYKVIANIPYYITGAILKKFLTSRNQPISMILLVQKEVADRIIGTDGKESILSLSVKAYGTPSKVSKVSKRLFNPPPNVDSAVLAIKNISRDAFKEISETLFFDLVKSGFSHKRKKMLNNFNEEQKKQISTVFDELGISLSVRAEDLSLQNWLDITKKSQKLSKINE